MLRVYARTNTFRDSAKFAKVSRQTWTTRWYELGLPSPKTTRINTSEEDLQKFEVAVVSDLHWGSIYQQKTVFDSFIIDCRDRGISTLINCGDTIEGLMARPYHDEVRFLHTTSDFEHYVQKHYPVFEHSYIINGNHETSLQKFEWRYNFCKEIAIRRKDIIYVEPCSLIKGPGGVKFCLHHGGSCAAPGESRNARIKNKTLQLMSEGCCAQIFLYGHCHSRFVVPSYMDSTIIGVGCFQAPDPFTIKSFGGADICGLILSYSVLGGQPVNIKTDFRFSDMYGGIIKNNY